MAAMTNTLRVASWNVREGVPLAEELSQREVRAEVVDLLLSYKVDIAALQEVDFDDRSQSFILSTIINETKLSYSVSNVLSESSFSANGRAGVAIASKFPLVNVRRRNFHNPNLSANLNGNTIQTHDKGWISATAIFAGLEISALSLHAFPFHLFGRKAHEEVFRPLWSELSTELQHLAKEPLIACGDFNTPRRDLVSVGDGPALERAVIDRPTYGDQAFDDVLYTEDFYLMSVNVVNNFSDHRMCFAEFAIADNS